ncbi:hypothetical protein T265_09982 [Opisthorchis viverrini]|uniref:Uncharacterized protein n=1 Tax=Opisthorchis viverrini TaxID=6198 RepID=A0A074ZEW6_OPIVI|nr:hypothetical protein T265_09982 [Opisthorchis viverrini]KER21775.1 hypothetical protein T265_09982 [Opisthorchis viverrini]
MMLGTKTQQRSLNHMGNTVDKVRWAAERQHSLISFIRLWLLSISVVVIFKNSISVLISNIYHSRSMVRRFPYIITTGMFFMSISSHILRFPHLTTINVHEQEVRRFVNVALPVIPHVFGRKLIVACHEMAHRGCTQTYNLLRHRAQSSGMRSG